MHGVVMVGLKEFVLGGMDRDTWKQAKETAGIDRGQYSRMEDYPDEEFQGIYEALLDQSDATDAQLQRQFGQFLFGELADMYGAIYFDDDWDVLELVDNVEGTIHQSLKRRKSSTFTPPELETEWTGDDRIAVLYGSERHLCELGKGLILGAADHYGAEVALDEPQCMKDGDGVCRIEVERTG